MNVLYLSFSYIPSRRASSVHVMKMCQAMARGGHRVTLVTKECAARQEPGVENDYDFYGVAPVFSILKLPRPEFRGAGALFSFKMWRLLRQKRKEDVLVYSRDLLGAVAAHRQRMPFILEQHGVLAGKSRHLIYRRLFQSPFLKRLVLISEALREDFSRMNLLPPVEKIIVAHDGADPLESCDADSHGGNDEAQDGNQARTPRPRIGYVGGLYKGKGMEVVTRLAKRMTDAEFHVIGGTEKDLARWRPCAPENLVFHGFVAHGELCDYYRRFDALLLPPQAEVFGASGRFNISRWMSPLKMFEYMSTGVAIVSSDLPVLREVLTDERNALLVPPDSLEAWERAVRRVIDDADLRNRLGSRAKEDFLNHYTWRARAERVLEGLSLTNGAHD